jgi:hypothetical protein
MDTGYRFFFCVRNRYSISVVCATRETSHSRLRTMIPPAAGPIQMERLKERVDKLSFNSTVEGMDTRLQECPTKTEPRPNPRLTDPVVKASRNVVPGTVIIPMLGEDCTETWKWPKTKIRSNEPRFPGFLALP